MPVCPKCGVSFSYTEVHVCEGYDRTKLWWMVSVAGGMLIGGLVGGLLGDRIGLLSGLSRPGWFWIGSYFFQPPVPIAPILGAVIGAIVTTVAVIAILARVTSKPKA